jgi:hypothetical protein
MDGGSRRRLAHSFLLVLFSATICGGTALGVTQFVWKCLKPPPLPAKPITPDVVAGTTRHLSVALDEVRWAAFRGQATIRQLRVDLIITADDESRIIRRFDALPAKLLTNSIEAGQSLDLEVQLPQDDAIYSASGYLFASIDLCDSQDPERVVQTVRQRIPIRFESYADRVVYAQRMQVYAHELDVCGQWLQANQRKNKRRNRGLVIIVTLAALCGAPLPMVWRRYRRKPQSEADSADSLQNPRLVA